MGSRYNDSNMVISSTYNRISGWSEMGTPDQHVFNSFGSADCEHKTVVLDRTKDLYFLSEADV